MPKRIGHYDKAAGGWDALLSSMQHLREQEVVAKGARTLLRANQPEGFDCPGCAWPDRNHHSSFEFCENGVKAVAAEATAHRIGAEFFARHTLSELAARDDHWLEAQGRLTEPLRYDAASDRYLPISWDAAFALIAQHLNAQASPHRALFYTSGRASNEAAFLYQLFAREFGTNNLPDCSNLCHEPSGVAMIEQVGVGKGTVTLDDFEQCEAIFVFGQNPGTNHPRMLGELRAAAKRGCRIVAVNPLRERGLERFAHPQSPRDMLGRATPIATHYYTPRIGGDLAFLAGMMKCVLVQDALDHAFVAQHTTGIEALCASLEAMPWDEIVRESGLPREQIEEAARVYIESRATIFCWGMGITQHTRSVATIQMLLNTLLLRGNIGRPGAGPCPVRGHSNVQGDRTMGIHERPPAAFLDRLRDVFGFEPPRADGHDVVGAIGAMERGEIDVFLALGGNFAAASPDSTRTQRALRRCRLTAHVATKLNRSHLVHGNEALILPCLGRTEIDLQAEGPQGVTVEDSMSMVHLSTGMNAPASAQLLSEPAIVARLAHATLPHSRIDWLNLIGHYDRTRDLIARCVEGFERFNSRVRVPGGFHLRNPAREREWRTATRRAQLMPHALHGEQANSTSLQLMTVRSHDQYNTTVYGLDDRYRGVSGERRPLFIAAADLRELGLRAGERVDLVSVWHDGERVAEDFLLVEYAIPSGCVASYFPETNTLVPLDHHAERARTPASKSIPVRLRRRRA
ncbi:MAG: FdhF/YdeP family oxidoreductase [Chiayiivirga sp.]|uniref:FdhF/YdeP family oxidoreductase n=1 Tax=Chiayiivirga sp. TaxID=2041042 RepID=UPI0025C48EC8|nr:FdhF/YdeP family oxidoreductase [Chiayiivirga sp.]MCI1711196.1 FdhF/YdeP family oxidoreductase [Chiayiivirga sp.]MCI1728005.1 FdhF/YdeP family oxidoreductase [Chiayiivirga sp.]